MLTIAIELVLIVVSFVLPVLLLYWTSVDFTSQYSGLQILGIPLIIILLPVISVFMFKERFISKVDLRWGILVGSSSVFMLFIFLIIYMAMNFNLPNQN
ncbi:magnesium-transporting ATPase (P-type) [Mucilaginibacter sp. UYNi724]